ncbi:MAG: hypothetical protein OHK0022_08930 [Roseiflexaceae bacterium]
MTILLVEDDAAIRSMIAEVLADEGYQVLTAEHGQAALDLLRRTRPLPSLILLDLMMPVMTGWVFRQAQLCDPNLASIPVVALSAMNNAEERAYDLGAEMALAKPLCLDSLLATVAYYDQPDW